MKKVTALFVAVVLYLDQPIAAQSTSDSVTPPSGDEILVVGMGEKGYRLSADQLRDAVRTFEKGRAEFAPAAHLVWRFRPTTASEGVSISLFDGAEQIPIEIDQSGMFTLPHERILKGDFRLGTNAARGTIRIQPLVLSPDSTPENMRVGDARLSCRVIWSFVNNEVSILTKAFFPLAGGCGSGSIKFYFAMDRSIHAVTVTNWSNPIRISEDRMSFQLPIAEKKIGDDEHIVVELEP